MAGEKEIGLLQIRTGKQRNLPKALELGELALTTDEARVFVGIPSTVIPASLVAGRTKESVPGCGEENVELLTEFTPIHVVNRAIYKPIRADIPGGTWKTPGEPGTENAIIATVYVNNVETEVAVQPGSLTLRVPSADRLFIDYVAFSMPTDGTSSKILESGTFSAVMVNGQPLTSQVNNTSDPEGVVWVRMVNNGITINGAMTNIPIYNVNKIPFRLEYIYRGWNEPL